MDNMLDSIQEMRIHVTRMSVVVMHSFIQWLNYYNRYINFYKKNNELNFNIQ